MSPVEALVQEFAVGVAGIEPEVVVSAPGRVNLLGQHIDHQGGFTNPIAIDRRISIAVARLDDPVLQCRNSDPKFAPFEIDLREIVARVVDKPWDDVLALGLVDSLPGARDSWARYVLGAALYLANKGLWTDFARGFCLYAKGDIPPAAGLSSSSALIVASMLALLKLLRVERPREELVTMAGEAEYFVGTRGGCGDHAAILLSEKDTVGHFGFHPFGVLNQVAFPPDWRVLVCHSGHGAEKSTDVRAKFNHRVMAYHLGRMWMRKSMSEEERERIGVLRDFLPEDARALPTLYKRLKKLPEEATAAEIRTFLDGDDGAERYLAQVSPEEPLDLRGVCLFGLAEMIRAKEFMINLEHGQMNRVVEIMKLSHDGDRVVSHNFGLGTRHAVQNDYSDIRMSQLAHRSMFDWGNPDGESQLWRQPGRYHSSTERLDLLVDVVHSCSQRAGAHLVGAGLGGCIAALCPEEDVDRIVAALQRRYYDPERLEPMIYRFQPEGGARVELSRADPETVSAATP